MKEKLSTDEKNCLWVKEEIELGTRDLGSMAINIHNKYYKTGANGSKSEHSLRSEFPAVIKKLADCKYIIVTLAPDKKTIAGIVANESRTALTPVILKNKIDTFMVNGEELEFDYIVSKCGSDITFPYGPAEIRKMITELYRQNLGYVYSLGKLKRQDIVHVINAKEDPLIINARLRMQETEKEINEIETKIKELNAKKEVLLKKYNSCKIVIECNQ